MLQIIRIYINKRNSSPLLHKFYWFWNKIVTKILPVSPCLNSIGQNLSILTKVLLSFKPFILPVKRVYIAGTRSSFKEIFASYKKWLLLDVAGVFPTEISMFFVPCSPLLGYHVIAFARLNRCLYFFRYVPALFAKWEDELSANMSRVRTAKFVIYIYSITHMCACVFYWVSCAYVMHPWVCSCDCKV